MKVALIGIGGRVGSRLAEELLGRGHRVTGIARNIDGIAARPGLTLKRGDANDPAALAALIAGHDALVSAGRFVSMKAPELIAAAKDSGLGGLICVGGAGSLELEPGKLLALSEGFPEAAKAEALAGIEFLAALRLERELDWLFISPQAEFAPGVKTGKYRLGKDELLRDAGGRSWISMEDFSVALVDELERPRHHRERFSVGY
jgi:Putative NADH-flavin reductase